MLITDAARSQSDQLRSREIRYVSMMGLRPACLILGAILISVKPPLLPLWLILCAAGMVFLPWAAVLIANDRPAKSKAERDAPTAAAASPHDARAAAGRGDQGPHHRRRRLGTARRPGPTAADPRAAPAASASAGSAPAHHAVSRPAAKASPAPVGSITGTRTPATDRNTPSRRLQTAPSPPRLTTTLRAHRGERRRLIRRDCRDRRARPPRRRCRGAGRRRVPSPGRPRHRPGARGPPRPRRRWSSGRARGPPSARPGRPPGSPALSSG